MSFVQKFIQKFLEFLRIRRMQPLSRANLAEFVGIPWNIGRYLQENAFLRVRGVNEKSKQGVNSFVILRRTP